MGGDEGVREVGAKERIKGNNQDNNNVSHHVAELTADGEQDDLVNHDKKLLLDQL